MRAFAYVIGVDEVGRGSIAGPLCVGAFLVRQKLAKRVSITLAGIKDSKQLSPRQREVWFRVLSDASREGVCGWSTAFVGEKVIDAKGLSFALKKAIAGALKKLEVRPEECLVLLDGGIKAPGAFRNQRTIIKGDEKEPLIAGASIMAKVCRDRYMTRLGRRYPLFGFERHKGYGTQAHYQALRKHGISGVHRRSFLKNFR
ncbi:MAG: ribonuclease HII [Candidatus Taylorbacteria bacterium]|nr:ribonuclease HII [Candidatus Taylorbacteria bacterium]